MTIVHHLRSSPYLFNYIEEILNCRIARKLPFSKFWVWLSIRGFCVIAVISLNTSYFFNF